MKNTKNIRITMQVENNVLHTLIHKFFSSVKEFCKQYHLPRHEVEDLLNLRTSPFEGESVEYREICYKITRALGEGSRVEQVFPPEIYQIQETREEFEISFSEYDGLIVQDLLIDEAENPEKIVELRERHEVILRVLDKLTRPQRAFLLRSFGFSEEEAGVDEKTMKTIMDLTKEERKRLQEKTDKALRDPEVVRSLWPYAL